MDRFDMSEDIKMFIDKAIRFNVIDPLDLYGLAVEHKEDWLGLINGVLEIAFSDRHVNSNHEIMVPMAENCWKNLMPEANLKNM